MKQREGKEDKTKGLRKKQETWAEQGSGSKRVLCTCSSLCLQHRGQQGRGEEEGKVESGTHEGRSRPSLLHIAWPLLPSVLSKAAALSQSP